MKELRKCVIYCVTNKAATDQPLNHLNATVSFLYR